MEQSTISDDALLAIAQRWSQQILGLRTETYAQLMEHLAAHPDRGTEWHHSLLVRIERDLPDLPRGRLITENLRTIETLTAAVWQAAETAGVLA